MRASSPFFARIRDDVLAITRSVPPGSLVTFSDIGQHLDVVPRHVAYILATLGAPLDQTVPWHRVVPEGGLLKSAKYDSCGQSQAELLRAEGVMVSSSGAIEDLDQRLRTVANLPHGLARQTRPADAPSGKSRPRKAHG